MITDYFNKNTEFKFTNKQIKVLFMFYAKEEIQYRIQR